MKNKIVLLFILMLISSIAYAQSNVTINGKVLSDSKEPIVGAMISDEGGNKGAITDDAGLFSMSFPAGAKVILNISCLGYKSVTQTITVPVGGGKLPKAIIMKATSLVMGDVNVQGKAPIGIVKGDTTQYNAAAFKVNPDASTQDLLSKMPGMTLSDNGGVQAQGEDIEVVYVDGKSYFKNDVATALSSLPVTIIESVQVYDDRSKQGKFLNYDDGDNKKAINIVTKKRDVKINWLGDVMVGYGTDNRYMASANINMLTDKNRLMIGGASNNINISPNQQRRFYGRGGQSGITTATGARVNYIRELKDDGEFSFSYILDNSNVDARKLINQQYLSTNQVVNKLDSSMNRNTSHTFDIEYKQSLNDKNRLELGVNANLSHDDNYTLLSQKSVASEGNSDALTKTSLNGDSFDIDAELDYIHKFNDKRNLSLNFEGSFTNDESDQLQTGYKINSQDQIEINEKTIRKIMGNNISGTLRYTEALSKSSRLIFSYMTDYDFGKSKRNLYAYDEAEGGYVNINKQLSSEYNRDYLLNSGGLGYVFQKKGHNLNLWANFQNAQLSSDYIYPETAKPLNKSYNAPDVRASYKFKGSNQQSLDISMRSTPSYPSADQLQDVLDVSDPLNVRNGNSNLSPSQGTRMRIRFNKSNMEKSTVFRLMAMVQNTSNMVVNDITMLSEDKVIQGVTLQKGTKYTTLTNLNGGWRIFSGAWYSMPLTKIKTNLELGVMYMYNRTPSIYNGDKFSSDTHSPSFMFRFTSNITQNIDFNISNRIAYSHSSSSKEGLNRSISEYAGAQLNYIFYKGFFVNIDYT
ncbi:MAG: outer membrane beta-barrel protein, partial [Rikenellaceae bacterium]